MTANGASQRAFGVFSGSGGATVKAGTFAKLVPPSDFGTYSSTGTVDQDFVVTAGTADQAHGVFLDTVTAAANFYPPVLVAVTGIVTVSVSPGKTINIRDLVAPDANGLAQPCTTGQIPAGRALSNTHVQLSTVDILLLPGGVAVAGTGALTYSVSPKLPSMVSSFGPASVSVTGGLTRGLASGTWGGTVPAGSAAFTLSYGTAPLPGSPTYVGLTPTTVGAASAEAFVSAAGSASITVSVVNSATGSLGWYYSIEA